MKLVYPNKKYLKGYEETFFEYLNNNVTTYDIDNPKEVNVIKKFYNFRKGINLPPNYVTQTTYWLIDKGEYIGEIALHHELTDALLRRGGNIGYGIRYSKWNKGYGTKMLAMALKKAKQLGLTKVLITCNHDNFASAKVIENNGGVLQDVIENTVDGKQIYTKRYWIEL